MVQVLVAILAQVEIIKLAHLQVVEVVEAVMEVIGVEVALAY